MASSSKSSSDTGLKIIAGVLGVSLVLAIFSRGDSDDDAWSSGEAEATESADDDADVEADPDDPWSAGADDDLGPEPARCDGVGWFSTDGGAIQLPVAASESEVPSPSCQLDDTAGGADDDAVALVQQVLVACNGQLVAVDGAYGPQTRQAISAVQAGNDIAVDGIYGPQTNAVMAWPVGTAPGDVVGEDPLEDRPTCTPGEVPAAPAGSGLPATD
jgi:peptidoglycan hydrolase-like protein with peptidoglycan-binding domain